MKQILLLSAFKPARPRRSWRLTWLLCFVLASSAAWATSGPLPDDEKPADVQGAPMYHRLLLCTDGSVMGWGGNYAGELGTANMGSSTLTPMLIPLANPAVVVQVAMGYISSFAIGANGSLWAWGGNADGQLGVGSTVSATTTPMQVPGLNNVVSVASGRRHTLALCADGTVWSWGTGSSGQLGTGSSAMSYTPQRISTLHNIRAVVSGDYFSLALDREGRVWSWGLNNYGQLGTGAAVGAIQYSPVALAGLPPVWQLEADEYRGAVLTADGRLYNWGVNWNGELALGHTNYTGKPELVGTFAGAVSIAMSTGTTFVVKADGSTHVWGNNQNGQLGLSTASPALATQPLTGPVFSPNVQITGTNGQFMSIERTGLVKTWGYAQLPLGYPPIPDVNGGSAIPTTPDGLCRVVPAAGFPACGPQRAYFQQPTATYTAALHGHTVSPAEIGTYGTTTIIDASRAPYNGKVVFDGVYHLRGNVRCIRGEFVLATGTVFYIDGQSGGTASSQTTMEVEGANLRLSNATLQANCPDKWAGIRLTLFGKIYTGGAGQRQRLRSRIADANVGVWTSETNEYYLSHTDFINNNIGVYDYNYQKSAAQPGEGVSNCVFTDNSGTGTGIWFEPMDNFNGTFAGDYTAASFTLNTFTNLRYGIYGYASNAPIDNNHFNQNWMAGIATYYNSGGSPMRVRNNTFTLPAALLPGQRHTTTYGLDVNNGWQLENNTFRCLSTVPNTLPLRQVGALVNGTVPMSGNTFRDLDLGLDLRTDAGGSYTITANTFFNNAEGIRFSATQSNPLTPSVTLRCNTFTSNVTAALGVWVQSSTRFPSQLGNANAPNPGNPNDGPNGNNFSGIADDKKRFVYDANTVLRYHRYDSPQESFGPSATTIFKADGNLSAAIVPPAQYAGSGACGTSSATPGVYARSGTSSQQAEPSALPGEREIAFYAAFPNPASETVAFHYALPTATTTARVVLRDMMGQVVRTLPIESGAAEARFSVQNLPTGFYTGALEVDGRIIATQKLSVKH